LPAALICWRKSPAAICADIAPLPPAKNVVFAGCAHLLAQIACGNLRGHRTFARCAR